MMCERTPLVYCFVLWVFSQLPVSAQSSVSVAEARLLTIEAGPVYLFEILNHHHGFLPNKGEKVRLSGTDSTIFQNLRRFRHLHWLITCEDRGGDRILTAANGLIPEDQEDDFPRPLVPDILPEPSIGAESHARATFGATEQTLVELTNIQRLNNGNLPPLKQVSSLHNAADGHSEAMAAINDFFAHCNLVTGTSPGGRMTAAGYAWNGAAENIAAGYGTPESAMTGWMGSSGHRANILSTNYRELGVGYEYSSDTRQDKFDDDGNCTTDRTGGTYNRYWTQNFGRRNNVYPVVIERELASTTNQTVNLYVYGSGFAASMRFSNDNTNWSGWVGYTPNYTWTLSPGSGMKTVYAQISSQANGGGTVYSANDVIQYSSTCDPMFFSNTTLSGTLTYTACEIIADPNVMISGQVTFQAGTVVLGSNVEVPEGALFEVQIQ